MTRVSGLELRVIGPAPDAATLTVVLLHGFGAPGDDLVSLAEVIDAPAGTRFVFPAAPLELGGMYGDARAWWMLDMARIERAMRGIVEDRGDEVPDGLVIDVGDGGDFAFDTSTVADDFDPPCTGSGADVFFTITLLAPEVIYMDTFGTDFDSVIVVVAGDCTPLGLTEACVDDECGGDAQGAWNLGAGTHCIIVDQGGSGQTGVDGHLQVLRTGHAGTELPSTSGMVSGDTCGEDDDNTAVCGCGQAEDTHYFLTLCPGASTVIAANVCTTSGYDAVMQIRSGAGSNLDCSDDEPCGDSSVSASVNGPGMFWVIMDGCAACGPYTMIYSY